MLLLKMKMMTIVVISLNYSQLCYNLKLNYHTSLNYLHWIVIWSFQQLPLMWQEKRNKKTKTKRSDEEHRHHNISVCSLYHGIFTIFQHHNAISYNSDEKELIIRLLTTRRLVRISPTRSKNAEVSSWWKGGSKVNTSSFLWCLRIMLEKMGCLLSHLTSLTSMIQIILKIWHLIQQCLIMRLFWSMILYKKSIPS